MADLTPGARLFIAQRRAQGLRGLTDEQADAIAALMVPTRVASGDVSPAASPGARGELETRAAS